MSEETAKEIRSHYLAGRGSIQDLARIYHVSVSEVLDLVGEGKAKTVFIPGDMIDEAEAGKGAEMNYGRDQDIHFTVD